MEGELLERARAGDNRAFDALVEPYRRELHAHCYRMLGSFHDADDALQEALLGAWKGLGGFQARSSLRSWLFRIATNAAIRIGRDRPRRVLSLEHGPSTVDPRHLGDPVDDPIWLEPYPDTRLPDTDPAARYAARESVEIAFVAALQRLPATQRAVLILRDVLAFSAAEVAGQLETSVASVNSSLQRARARIGKGPTQRQTIAELGEDGVRKLLDDLVAAWERADVPAISALLVRDATLAMPPLPAWFDGRDAVCRFMAERMFATPWRVRPTTVNGQLALACYQLHQDVYRLGGITALTLEARRIGAMTSFLAPMLDDRFGLPPTISG